MTDNISRVTTAGLVDLQYSVLSSADYAYGAAATLANGSDSGAVFLDGVESLSMDIPDRRTVTTTGDDGALGQFDFDPDSMPSGTVGFGTFNGAFAALANDSLMFADGGVTRSLIHPVGGDRPTFMLMANSQAKSRDSGSVGEAGFWVTTWYKVRADIKGDDGLTNASPSSFSGTLNANSADTTPWGKALSTSDEGRTEGYGDRFWSKYRWTTHTFVGDGATTSFTLGKTVAAGDAAHVLCWDDGVKATYTTNYTASGTTFTLVGTARAAGVVISVAYGYTV